MAKEKDSTEQTSAAVANASKLAASQESVPSEPKEKSKKATQTEDPAPVKEDMIKVKGLRRLVPNWGKKVYPIERGVKTNIPKGLAARLFKMKYPVIELDLS